MWFNANIEHSNQPVMSAVDTLELFETKAFFISKLKCCCLSVRGVLSVNVILDK